MGSAQRPSEQMGQPCCWGQEKIYVDKTAFFFLLVAAFISEMPNVLLQYQIPLLLWFLLQIHYFEPYRGFFFPLSP